MSSAALPLNPLLPQSPGGNAPGAALALLVHAGLVAVLALGIDWRNREPDTVSAELWAAVPQMAAPPPAAEVAPPPPPPLPAQVLKAEPVQTTPTPDIAIEQNRKRKAEAERKRVEQEAEVDRKKREKLEKLEAQKQADKLAQEKANDERLAQQHKDNVRRLMGQAGAAPGQTATTSNAATTGIAARSAAPSATYAGKVNARVRQYIVFPGSVANDAVAEVEVNSAPGGSIISRRLIKSSGNKEWDEAVLRAIDKTSSLPPDTDGRVPARLIIAFKWNE